MINNNNNKFEFIPVESSKFAGKDVTDSLLIDDIFRNDVFDEIISKSDIVCYNAEKNLIIFRRDITGDVVQITTWTNRVGSYESYLHMIKSSLTTNTYLREDLPEDGWVTEKTPIYQSTHKIESLIGLGYRVYVVEKDIHHLIFNSLKDLNRDKYYQINTVFNEIASESDFFKSVEFSRDQLAEIFLHFFNNIESHNLLNRKEFQNDKNYRTNVLMSSVRNSFPYLFQAAQKDQIDHYLNEGLKIIVPFIPYCTKYQILENRNGKYQLSTISLSKNIIYDSHEYSTFDEVKKLGFGAVGICYILDEKIFKLDTFNVETQKI